MQKDSRKSASKYFITSFPSLLGLITWLRIFSNALKKHIELHAPKLRLQAAPLWNMPLWQTNLSVVMLEMEGYRTSDLDSEAANATDSEHNEKDVD